MPADGGPYPTVVPIAELEEQPGGARRDAHLADSHGIVSETSVLLCEALEQLIARVADSGVEVAAAGDEVGENLEHPICGRVLRPAEALSGDPEAARELPGEVIRSYS
jgi:hypothetical protein